MGARILDKRLVDKVAQKTRRPPAAIGVTVSKNATRNGISSEAALVLLAKKHGIGTLAYERTLDALKRAEIRDGVASQRSSRPTATRARTPAQPSRPSGPTEKATLKFAIDSLIQDPLLKSRCRDILLASSNFDRPINQATQVLEDRIRRKVQPDRRLTGETLVNYAFHETLERSRLHVASGDPDDQRGVTQILRGIVPAFRNITHHHIVGHFSREDAMRICGFVDILLRVVDSAKRVEVSGAG